jgi:pilus assembly protein Flp/PilA
MMEIIKRLCVEEKGQGMAEYGLILALVAVAVIVVLGSLGSGISDKFQEVTDGLAGADSAEGD